jgi:hypothetical protein
MTPVVGRLADQSEKPLASIVAVKVSASDSDHTMVMGL